MGRKPGSGVIMEMLDGRKADFERLYFRQRLALRGVAEELGVSVKMLTLWMDGLGIVRRNRAQAQHNRSKRLGKTEAVIRLRLVDKLTMEQIAERLKYSSKGTVHSILSYRGLDGPVETLPSYETFLRDRRHGRYAERKPIHPDGGDNEESGDPGQGSAEPTG